LVLGKQLLVRKEIQGRDCHYCGRFRGWPVKSATQSGILGIDLAEKQGGATPRLSLMRERTDARRRQVVMKKLRQILVAVLMGTMMSVGVFAQKGNDNRPPEEQPKVVDKEKEQKPPPSNNNQNNNKPRKP
jgi:hypothetical protein